MVAPNAVAAKTMAGDHTMMSEARPPRFILASASPRRCELLRTHGYRFEVIPSRIDESTVPADNRSPAALAEHLSLCKARDVASRLRNGVVLAGDTIVALNDRIIGKPADREDARRILLTLTGTRHEVITGVALVNASTGAERVAHDRTVVEMRAMSDADLEAYLDGGAWRGKAGAYGIQDEGDRFVTQLEGSFTNVVGMPMALVARLLSDWGISPAAIRESS